MSKNLNLWLNKHLAPWWIIIGLLFFAISLRWLTFGEPLLYPDEDWYLYAGGQMIHGNFPYSDIWDRKPFGLFVLYAFFHLFGSLRFIAYQVGALVSLWLTSIVMIFLGRLIAPLAASTITACIYIACVNMFQGYGGQTPVFYNSLVITAVALVAYYWPRFRLEPKLIQRVGSLSMLLFALSIELKPTVIFEGAALGLFLLWQSWSISKSILTTIFNAVLWCTVALAPTIIVALIYWYYGHGSIWWFCNVTSIFQRGDIINHAHAFGHGWRVKKNSLLILTAATPLSLYLSNSLSETQKKFYWFLFAWAGSALFAILCLTAFSGHYFLPLLPPVLVLASPIWKKQFGKGYLIFCLIYCAIKGEIKVNKIVKENPKSEYLKVAKLLSSPPGCIFQLSGRNLLLEATSISEKCHLTNFPFPGHIGRVEEQKSLGINTSEELNKILALHPQYLSREVARSDDPNFWKGRSSVRDIDTLFQQEVNKNYIKIYPSKKDLWQNTVIWRLKPNIKPH